MNDTRAAFVIGRDTLDLEAFRAVAGGRRAVVLGDDARARITGCDLFRRRLLASDRRIYGVNTGFGRLADTVIPPADQAQLQRNLVRSHAVGWGPPLDAAAARGMILLRALSLAHGYSGVRVEVVEQLLWLLDSGLHPWIPSRGSVGASGDLAPLSHLALVLMGEGHLLDIGGARQQAAPVLAGLGRPGLELQAKEGLALINGTQLMNSLGLLAVGRAQDLVGSATVAAALSLEALEGSAQPFGAAYHALRRHPEIADVAACIHGLLAGSEVLAGHRGCARVQDPYSVRCAPQVIGATLGVVRQAGKVLLREAASVTDNPVLLPDSGEVITGGHFHGQPLALQLDFLYQAVAELANIAERRVNLLLGGNGGRLPRFLAGKPGLESGLMIAQYLAAGLVVENRSKAFPAAVDSVPTSDGQEDHVSMGSVGAVKLEGVLERTTAVVAIELLTAARALQFVLRGGLAARRERPTGRLALPLDQVLAHLGAMVDLAPGDRPLSDDVAAVAGWVRGGSLPPSVTACLAPILAPIQADEAAP